MQSTAFSASDFSIINNIYGGFEHRFVFPRLPIKTQFDSAEEIKNQLREQAIEGGAPDLEKLYDFLFTPLKSDIKNLTVRCKICKSQIRFYSEGNKLLLISVDNKHNHKSERFKEIEAKYINTFLSSRPNAHPHGEASASNAGVNQYSRDSREDPTHSKDKVVYEIGDSV